MSLKLITCFYLVKVIPVQNYLSTISHVQNTSGQSFFTLSVRDGMVVMSPARDF